MMLWWLELKISISFAYTMTSEFFRNVYQMLHNSEKSIKLWMKFTHTPAVGGTIYSLEAEFINTREFPSVEVAFL